MKKLKYALIACSFLFLLPFIFGAGCPTNPCQNNPCDDDLFCNGVETCTADGNQAVCGDGTPIECPEGQTCNEDTDICEDSTECETDDDCDDGDLCTDDTCEDGICVNHDVECPEGEYCDPRTGECDDIDDIVLEDDFDGETLDPNWSISYQNVDPEWYYSVPPSNSNLIVTEIEPDHINNEGGGIWSTILFSHNDFDPLEGNFTVTCNFSWDEEGQDAAMQNLWFFLYDTDNQIIARAGYYDPWCLHEGTKYAAIGSELTDYDYLPFSGDASIIISREESTINVYWDDQLLLTGTNDNPFRRIVIAFDYYPNVNSSCQSIFGTESVDLVRIK